MEMMGEEICGIEKILENLRDLGQMEMLREFKRLLEDLRIDLQKLEDCLRYNRIAFEVRNIDCVVVKFNKVDNIYINKDFSEMTLKQISEIVREEVEKKKYQVIADALYYLRQILFKMIEKTEETNKDC